MASIDYYNDDSQHGNYQYVTMRQIIDDYMASRDQDDYTALTPRYQVLYQTMKAFRHFYYDVVQEIRAIRLDLSPSLTVTLPPDFVNYVRISWVDAQGELRPMAIDRRMDIAQNYLQDDSYNLLFDNDGCVLIGSDVGAAGSGTQPIGSDTDLGSLTCYRFSDYGWGAYQPNRDMSKVFMNGKFIIDKTNGFLKFGSEVEGRSIVIEYISDGLFKGCEGRPEDELRIHKFAEEAIHEYIYYNLIKRRKHVPANEKQRAKKDFYNARRVAKLRMSTLRKDELLQLFRGQSKVIK